MTTPEDSFIEMDEDTWYEMFKPIFNEIDKRGSSFDGHMFETYGDELKFVQEYDPKRVWMYGDGDDGGTYIWSGYGFINRLGYFITENPCPDNVMIQVQISIPFYFCESCEEEWEDKDNVISDKWNDLGKCPNCATLEETTKIEGEHPDE